MKIKFYGILCGCLLGSCWMWADTVVLFETSLGDFEVQLYDRDGATRTTPLTVANFLTYVQAEAYNGSFIHRRENDFVMQGGGYYYVNNAVTPLVANAPVVNEPGNPNVRGTIAMAKTAAGPDTATNQWFFNLKDNSVTLGDQNNGGFTVFGHVLGEGMDVVDALASVQVYNLSVLFNSPAFTQVPLWDGTYLLGIISISVVPFEVTEMIYAPGSVTLRWSGAGDVPVQVLRATNLVTTDWQTLATGLTSGEYVDPAPPASGPSFYQVKMP